MNKVRDGIYKIIFSSKSGSPKVPTQIYSINGQITTVVNQFTFQYATFNGHQPQAGMGLYIIDPTLNTVSQLCVIVSYAIASNTNPRISITANASSVFITLSCFCVIVDFNNPPVISMCNLATTNSTTVTLKFSTYMSTVSVGDTIQFGNNTTTIPTAIVSAISEDLLTITLNSARSVPVNTVLTFIKPTHNSLIKYKNNVDYQIDWSVMEQGKYRGNFAMELPYNNVVATTALAIPLIHFNAGTDIKNYEASFPTTASTMGGISSRFIGSLTFDTTFVSLPMLRSFIHSNPDFLMDNIPKNNNLVNIQILGYVSNTSNVYNKPLWVDGSTGCGDYVLTLFLEKVTDSTLPFYNIVFNSKVATLPNTYHNNFIQSFNWNVLPEGKYKCSFYTMSGHTQSVLQVGTTYPINMIYSNISLTNTFEVGNSDGSIQTFNSNCLGVFANVAPTSTPITWITPFSLNHPFVITRPQNNNVNFTVVSNLDKVLTLYAGNIFPQYILVLHMELIE